MGKEFTWNTGDMEDVGSIPLLGRSPGEGNGNPLECGESQRVGHDWMTKHTLNTC